MTGRIIITGISDAEKAAKEILEHIQAIKDIQRRMVWFGSDIQIVLDSKEEAASLPHRPGEGNPPRKETNHAENAYCVEGIPADPGAGSR